MITLYDVLGARAGDDSETLKTAFRTAVKASHPDLHAEDPNAVERFRQIVRANAILSDPDQRAVYDHLLAFERWQKRSNTRRGFVLDTLRNLAVDAVTVVLLAGLVGGSYLVFMRLARSSVDTVQATEMSATSANGPSSRQAERQSGQSVPAAHLSRQELHELIAGPEPSAPAVDGEPRENNASAPSPATVAAARTVEDTVAEGVPAPAARDETSVEQTRGAADSAAARSDDVPSGDTEIPAPKPNAIRTGGTQAGDAKIGETPLIEAKPAENSKAKADGAQTEAIKASEARSSDPKFYFERGVASYRNGDLAGALADFNQAILLDPYFTSAYVNRSIVLYRKAEVDRAFADVAQATRIQDSLKPVARSHRAGASSRN